MRNNQHDAVTARLMIPIDAADEAHGASQPSSAATSNERPRPSSRPRADAVVAASAEEAVLPQQEAGRPATDEDPQAVAASSAEPGLASGTPEPGPEAQGETDGRSPSVCDSSETSEDEQALVIYQQMVEDEQDESVPEHIRKELGNLLFKKKEGTTAGLKRRYVDKCPEVVNSITTLLKRRRTFMAANALHGEPPGSGVCVEHLANGEEQRGGLEENRLADEKECVEARHGPR